jgi:photosystem II stability/assembly factor-like uncharacterized protein
MVNATLAVDPTTSGVVYAGTTGKIAKSVDGGMSWVSQSISISYVNKITVDPKAPGTLYVAGGGVFKSSDGGKTWNPMSGGTSGVWVDPTNSLVLYAASVLSGDGSCEKSIDGGITWKQLEPLLGELAIAPSNPSILYGSGFGLFRSITAGE